MSGPNYGFLPAPDQLQFTEWASIAAEQLAAYGVPTPSSDEATWQIWAANFVNVTLPGTQVADPYGFSTWQDWAHAVVGTLA